MKVAVIHDWLTGMRGGEKVLEAILEIFPEAEIFTLICNEKNISEKIKKHKINTSFLQNIPGIFKFYRNFLPFFPAAIESFNLKKFDLVISSSHCVAKGVKVNGIPHICYCHTPMRYAYDQFSNYFSPKKNGWLKYKLISAIMPLLRNWDIKTAGRVTEFIANSENIRQKIKKYYEKDAEVIYPPVDIDFYSKDDSVKKSDFYLIAGALVEYKKPDFVVDVFNNILKTEKLIIAGNGPMLTYLEKIKGNNIEIVKNPTDFEMREYYRKARCLLFPGEEDFGITMVEAISCGTPVLALKKGGALEIIKEGKTGEFFDGTVQDFIKKLEKINNTIYNYETMINEVKKFSKENFILNFKNFLERKKIG